MAVITEVPLMSYLLINLLFPHSFTFFETLDLYLIVIIYDVYPQILNNEKQGMMMTESLDADKFSVDGKANQAEKSGCLC